MGKAGSARRDLADRAESFAGDLVSLRRELHQYPELGFEEVRTQSLLRRAVERLVPGASCRPIARTGLLVSIGDARPGVLLRACIDGLPIHDECGAAYASKVPGKSHACGHDGQAAMLVGALAVLASTQPSIGVHALFQPAEEIDAGAKAVLEEGVLDEITPSVVFGFHGHPGLESGTVSVRPGPVMASITTLRCRVLGREGHGAEPHLAIDAVTAAASLVLDWQVALARRVDPRQPLVLSVGRLSAGTTPNVVPGLAEIEGTIRSLNPSLQAQVEAVVSDVARGIEIRTGTKIEISLERVVPAVVNDRDAVDVAASATSLILGPDALVEAEPTLGGDDFAWYLQRYPGCYVFVGERKRDLGSYGWHNASYDLDERALTHASAVLAGIALQASEGDR